MRVVEEMAHTVLLVDDEPRILVTVRQWLEQAGLRVLCAATSQEAIRCAQTGGLLLALIDYRLKEDLDGVSLGSALASTFGLPFVLFSGYLTPEVGFAAAKAGAVAVLRKPLTASEVLNSVLTAPQAIRVGEPMPCTPTAREAAGTRWAGAVLLACGAETDPKTLSLWGRAAGMSRSSIRDLCVVSRVRPRGARDLARFLRALSRSRKVGGALIDYFDTADPRTLECLIRCSGLAASARTASTSTVSLFEFFHGQIFVPNDRPCVRTLCHMAANSEWFA